MAIGGISISNILDFRSQNPQSNLQKAKQEFQQLGTDLQSGNLSAAQADLATLLQSRPQSAPQSTTATAVQNATTPGQSGSAIAQDFAQLSTDLQSGNLAGAQADYTSILQAFQNQAAQSQTQGAGHGHRHHGGENSNNTNSIAQLFSTLGQALQAGNLSSAQQAYTTLQQDFTQFANSSAISNSGSGASTSTGLSVNA